MRLLENETVLKVGLSLHDDIAALRKLKLFNPGNFYDVQKHVSEIGIEDLSLQKIYANLFGEKISKSQRLTNWEADILSEKQKVYAATDAWTCLNIYNEINRLKSSGNYSLMKVEENTNPQPTINTENGFITKPEQFSLLPGVCEAIKKINKSGYLAIVITNQPVIARGDCTFEELQEIHNKMETEPRVDVIS